MKTVRTRPPSDEEPPPGGFLDDDDDGGTIDWRNYGVEDLVTFVLFWALAFVVLAQFFSRYVMNDSIGWTEEVARYLLIMVGFVGGAIAVRRNSHITIEVFYRWFPQRLGRLLSFVVDVVRVGFFAWGTYLSYLVADLVKGQRMTALDISKGWVYAAVTVGFALMTARSVQVMVRHLRAGGVSALSRHSVCTLAD